MNRILTKDKLQEMIDEAPPQKQEAIVGRALVALLKRQTSEEQSSHSTIERNGQGFNGVDAEWGTICARKYQHELRMPRKMTQTWLKKNKNGYSRITRYWKQLDEEAQNRHERTASR